MNEDIAARAKAAVVGPLSLKRCIALTDIAREDIPYLLAQLEDRDKKLEAEKAALEREIRVVIAATPRGDTDAPFRRGRLGSLLFVRDRILKGGE